MAALRTRGIDHINLQVADLEETVRFYGRLLGFKVLEDIPSDNGKIIGDENAKLALYESKSFGGYEKRGFHHIGFNIENFEDVERKCQELGVEVLYGGEVKWPGSRSVYIKDPNGYELELTEVWGASLHA